MVTNAALTASRMAGVNAWNGIKTLDSLLPQHASLIAASGIAPDVAEARGYRSVTLKNELSRLDFSQSQRLVPTLLVPVHTVHGKVGTYQHRPDTPRIVKGKSLKYETPSGSWMVLDVPPAARQWLAEPTMPLFITEGVRKADSAVSNGLCCIALLGVWNWRGTNEHGGKTALPDWEYIALNGRRVYIVFDSDVMLKTAVHGALARIKSFLEHRGAKVAVVYLPAGEGGAKVGLDDYLAGGHTAGDLLMLSTTELREPARPQASTDHDGLPVIEVSGRPVREKTNDALAALGRRNEKAPRFFQQANAIVWLRREDDGECRVEPMLPDHLAVELNRAADWVRTTAHGQVVTDAPVAVLRDILALPHYELPRIRGIVSAPLFTRAGLLVTESGYHAGAELYMDLRGFTVPPVPPAPSAADVARALDAVNEPIRDFPFDGQASRAHAIALLITGFVRNMIDGPTPLFGIDAPVPGTGKSLLADVASLVATGQTIAAMSPTKGDDEFRKRITALLLDGRPLVLFDNMNYKVAGSSLSTMLTARLWSDRILGLSRMVRIPNRTISMVTGNNLAFSGELLRRTVLIRMDAKREHPEDRKAFRHPDLPSWVLETRHDIVWGVLTLVQHWIAGGCVPFGGRVLGSFGSWTRTIGGVLAAAGIPGFLENIDAFRARGDAEASDWAAFVEVWWKEYAYQPVTIAQLFPLASDFIPELLGDGNERSQRTRLGLVLARKVDVVAAGRRVVETDVQDDNQRRRRGYALQTIEDLLQRESVPAGDVRSSKPNLVDHPGDDDDELPPHAELEPEGVRSTAFEGTPGLDEVEV